MQEISQLGYVKLFLILVLIKKQIIFIKIVQFILMNIFLNLIWKNLLFMNVFIIYKKLKIKRTI